MSSGEDRRASSTSFCCTSAGGRIHRATTSSVWSSARGGTTSRLLQQFHLLHQRPWWSTSRHQQTSPHLFLLCTTPRQLQQSIPHLLTSWTTPRQYQQCTWPCSWGFCWPTHAVPRVAEHLSLSRQTRLFSKPRVERASRLRQALCRDAVLWTRAGTCFTCKWRGSCVRSVARLGVRVDAHEKERGTAGGGSGASQS